MEVSVIPCLLIYQNNVMPPEHKFWWTHYAWGFSEPQSEYKELVLHVTEVMLMTMTQKGTKMCVNT